MSETRMDDVLFELRASEMEYDQDFIAEARRAREAEALLSKKAGEDGTAFLRDGFWIICDKNATMSYFLAGTPEEARLKATVSTLRAALRGFLEHPERSSLGASHPHFSDYIYIPKEVWDAGRAALAGTEEKK